MPTRRAQVRCQGARLWVPRLKLVFLFPSRFTGAPTHQAPQAHHSVLRLLFDDPLQPDRVWGICLSVCLSDTFTAITSTAHAPRRFSTKMHGMNSCRELGVRMWEAVSVLGGTVDTGSGDGQPGRGTVSGRSQPRAQKGPGVTWAAGWQGPGQQLGAEHGVEIRH